MKLQYLGDSRDAFKWDLIHWICTTTSFHKLVFVPLLTPDLKGSNEGQIPHHRFNCKDFIRPFLDSLKENPRSFDRISLLGRIAGQKQFEVAVFAPERVVGSGSTRLNYWKDFDPSPFENSIVFFDPDNGFETKTQRGAKWIRHEELQSLFARLPRTAVALVYQHRPRRTWVDLFDELKRKLTYVHAAIAAHEATLAFIALAGTLVSGLEIATALKRYARNHPTVRITPLSPTFRRRSLEMCSPDGKEDGFILDEILDNPAANKAFEDGVIRDAVAGGMPLEQAIRLFRSMR
jgi:hypothetical protein